MTRSSRLFRTLVESPGAVQHWHWALIAVVILLVDYLTGPYIQFPILFVVPVALAAAGYGLAAGVSVAVLMPGLRMLLFLVWRVPLAWPMEAADTLVDVVILSGFALLVDRMLRQEREIRVLEGMLPICGSPPGAEPLPERSTSDTLQPHATLLWPSPRSHKGPEKRAVL